MISNAQKLNMMLGHEVSISFDNGVKHIGPIRAVLTDIAGLDFDLFQAKVNGDAILTFHTRTVTAADVLKNIIILAV